MRKDYYEENTGVFLFGIYDTVKRTDSDPARTHLHAEPEIALVTCGSAEYLLGKDRFEVRENDVVFIPPNIAHAVFSPCDAGLKTLTARISPYCLWEVFAEFTDDGKIAAMLSGKLCGKICSPSVARLFSELAEAFRTGERYAVKIAMLNLTAEICKSVDPENSLPKKSHVTEVRNAIAFIRENCGQAVLLSDMAKAAEMSRTRFAEAFRTVTGVTPHDFLLITRTEKAEKLIADGDLSITEIVYEAGFDNVTSFNKAFKKKNGITPSEYKKRISRE